MDFSYQRSMTGSKQEYKEKITTEWWTKKSC